MYNFVIVVLFVLIRQIKVLDGEGRGSDFRQQVMMMMMMMADRRKGEEDQR